MKYKSGEEFVKNLVSQYCPDPTVSSNLRLDIYYQKAHTMFNHALEFVKQGHDARSYIELMRYCQLITILNTHNSYNETQYLSDKKQNKKRLLKAITKLETLKPKLIKSYDEQIEKEKQAALQSNQSQSESDEQNEPDEREQQQQDTNINEDIKQEINEEKKQDISIKKDNRWNNLKIESSPYYKKQAQKNHSKKNVPKNNNKPKNNLGAIFTNPLQTITPIIMTDTLVSDFVGYCSKNTQRDIETCGILTGKYLGAKNAYIITHVVIPKQKGSANTVQTLNEEELIGIQEKYGVVTLGWIHSHPSQTCFLSSVDLHCQLSYQIMMPNAIAIVHAPQDKTDTFTLTRKGIDILSNCSCHGFHKHDQDHGLYHTANHIQSVQHQKCKFIDLR